MITISKKRKKGRVDKDHEGSEGVVLPDLPDDVISRILSGIPIEPLMRFRSVCKGWQGLTKDPYFIDLQLNKAQSRYILSPITADRDSIRSLFLVDEGITREIPVENIPGKPMAVVASCNGLLCIVSKSKFDKVFIYNPITRECVTLPRSKIKRRNKYCDIGFGFDSKNKEYKVVRFCNLRVDSNSKFDTEGEIITLGEKSWRRLDVPYGVHFDNGSKFFNGLGPVFVDGAFHWIINRNTQSPSPDHILALDIFEEKFHTITFLRHIEIPDHLVNLGDTLALVEYCGNWQMRIWQLLGGKTTEGYWMARCAYHMVDRPSFMGKFSADFKLAGMMSNDCFLLVVRDSEHCMDEARWHVIRYFPRTNEYSVDFASGIPRFFDIISFQPSLVSLSSAINSPPLIARGDASQKEIRLCFLYVNN